MSRRIPAALALVVLALLARPGRADEGERPPWLGIGIEDGQRGVRITEVI
jgi:hypothetical protein